ncbi:ABC transporter permease [Paenibacillus dendritiformis]|uniref:ABC transporter permease n=1 Tax=Paenibacillus dendritiformis TaxID=130049 RepID=UPI0018CE5A51|nr:ABC transporter permease [Paenibacillus dendritiformis]MBG9792554.1 ABC transporter permease [Paenibacillus dendritiformis]
MKLLFVQFKIELLRVIRNPYFVFWSLLMPMAFYFIFTRIVNVDVENKTWWQAHYLMSVTGFSVMGSAIMTLGIRIVQERENGWTTYMRITPLPGIIYFAGKMFGQFMMHLFSIIAIFLCGYLVNGVSLSWSAWLGCGLWLLLGSIPFLGLGALVGTMKRVDTASGVSNAIFMLLAITGGMWFPLDILPKFIQMAAKALPAYHFGGGAWEIVRGETPQWEHALFLAGYLLLFMILSTYIRKKQEAV